MTMRFLLISAALFVSSHTNANELLKKSDPKELSFSVIISSDCLVEQRDIERVVEDVFLSSGIKPNNDTWYSDAIHLRVSISCLATPNNYPVFITNAVFVDYSPSTKFMHAVLSKEYSRLGMGSKSIALISIKVSVQNAISDFIKINYMTSDQGKEG